MIEGCSSGMGWCWCWCWGCGWCCWWWWWGSIGKVVAGERKMRGCKKEERTKAKIKEKSVLVVKRDENEVDATRTFRLCCYLLRCVSRTHSCQLVVFSAFRRVATPRKIVSVWRENEIYIHCVWQSSHPCFSCLHLRRRCLCFAAAKS